MSLANKDWNHHLGNAGECFFFFFWFTVQVTFPVQWLAPTTMKASPFSACCWPTQCGSSLWRQAQYSGPPYVPWPTSTWCVKVVHDCVSVCLDCDWLGFILGWFTLSNFYSFVIYVWSLAVCTFLNCLTCV